jgi:hypothetical protein
MPLQRFTLTRYHDPSCTMWARTSNYANFHSSEQGTLPTSSLICKQAVPYRTCGNIYHPGVYTPKTRPLADSSMTIHITRQNPTISTIPTLLKPQHRSSPWSPHITTDGRPTLAILTQAKLNVIKMERLVRLS